MRYENLQYSDKILPLILRDDTLYRKHHQMYIHWHEAVELLYITHGRLRVLSGMERADAEEGDLVCIHSGHMHLYEALTEHCRYYCIIFPRQALDSNELYVSSLPRVCHDGTACAWMEQLLTVLKEKKPFYRERGRGLLTQLYARLAEIGGEESLQEESRPTRLVKSAMEYINEHYYQPQFGVEQVAVALRVSRFHLSHVFKEVTGKTLSAYCQELRCDRARRRLQNGLTVADAAEQSGFSSQSYFSRAYLKHFGVLPSKDRGK